MSHREFRLAAVQEAPRMPHSQRPVGSPRASSYKVDANSILWHFCTMAKKPALSRIGKTPITTKELERQGISRNEIQRLVKAEKILRIGRGVYQLTEAELIRSGIVKLSSRSNVVRDITLWEEEKRFIRSLMKKGPLKGKRRWKRKDLYER